MKSTIFFRILAAILIIGIVFVTLSPLDLRPTTGASATAERFAAFAALGAVFSLAYPKRYAVVLVLLIGLVGFLEMAQNYIPDRHGRLPDSITKLSGAFLGVAVARILSR
ncbi:hypothetical protein KBI52_10040 [Microvirga sp. HBU67558]|uniref:VanZ family protein n=1 Tax=Microvirga TaxID=186650 RepID=UPI001B35C3F2|nr:MULTISPECIES: hypothetical protein [unclassified Microvirga]MBQ0820542.1 hypothetical protein [Microvirga sp. HBU67558]